MSALLRGIGSPAACGGATKADDRTAGDQFLYSSPWPELQESNLDFGCRFCFGVLVHQPHVVVLPKPMTEELSTGSRIWILNRVGAALPRHTQDTRETPRIPRKPPGEPGEPEEAPGGPGNPWEAQETPGNVEKH